jgi:radical SAM superfamily enzyme YgiQ (UPF0313 family)
MKHLRIYLGDLTHDSVGLATEVFPLNVGFVAAYAKQRFGDEIDVRIFKYIDQLEDAIYDNPPDILALSNYPWCHNIGMALMGLLAARRPEALRVMGGPNFPHDAQGQREFLLGRPLLDAYVYLDGEVGFSNLVELIGRVDVFREAREVVRTHEVKGCVQLTPAGQLVATPEAIRLKGLDELPSPYLMGLMDPFFDGRLSPMIQTNRGCPFKCTFCHDGTDQVNRVNQFSVARVQAEIKYICERVPKNVHSLFISDLNFGMYTRDAKICAALAEAKKEHGYPSYIDCTTGKNSKRRIINAIEQLDGLLGLTMSVQSLNPQVLGNIKRDNIRLADFLELGPAIRKANLPTISEVILGLPGETRDGHLEGLGDLLNSGIDHVTPYTLMLLNGTEMNTPEERSRWGFETKFRVIPRDFTRLRSGEVVVEIEEVVVATNTLSFDDYVYCRKIALAISLVNHMGFRALLRFFIENDVPIMDLMRRMVDGIDAGVAPARLVQLLGDFERETSEELWDDADELTAFFQNAEHFSGLLDGTYGANLIQTYRARGFAHCFAELADYAFAHARQIVDSPLLDQVELFCRGRTQNLFGADRLESIPETNLSYDFDAWLAAEKGKRLSEFAWGERPVRFVLTREQHGIIEDGLKHFGQTDLGLGKLLIRINLNTLWRRTVAADSFDASQIVELGRTPAFYAVSSSNWHYS